MVSSQLERLKQHADKADKDLATALRLLETAEWGFSGEHSHYGVVEHAGWLTKMGNRVRNWKRRWFTLRSGCIYYYRSKETTIHEGIIPLGVETVVECVEAKYGRDNCFVIENPRRAYVLVAPNTEEMETWINVVLQVVARQLSKPHQPLPDAGSSDDEREAPEQQQQQQIQRPIDIDSDDEGTAPNRVQQHTVKPLSDRERLKQTLEDVQMVMKSILMVTSQTTTAVKEHKQIMVKGEDLGPDTLEAMLRGVDEYDYDPDDL
eukprot:c13338_g1_i1.p1 GENE.c13338_g1_i1~~c13338_g1_i1.p1  ORF type:complete len:280 (+),score=83.97 c13338_g1_i1:53-841(+)